MLFYIFMAVKISISDIRHRKIKNHDLLALLVVGFLHRSIHQLFLALAILVAGALLAKFIGAGDAKLLAIVVALHTSFADTYRALIFIAFATALLVSFYLLRHRRLNVKIPFAPALCVGLVI